MSESTRTACSTRPTSWQGTPATILGMSQTGMSAVAYLTAKGATCFLSEMLPGSPANKAQRDTLNALAVPFETGGHTARCFEHSPWVIVSPGIPQHAPVLTELSMSGKCVMSDVELAYWEAPCPMVAITGTNGKTTTTLLVSALLQASGLTAPVCGNIGSPILSHLMPDRPTPDVLVAELSSAQIAMTHQFRAKIAILTNFRPDHLDWHGSLEAYKQAKFKLFTGEQAPDWAVLNAADPTCMELASQMPSAVCYFALAQDLVQDKDCYVTLSPSGTVVFKPSGQAPAELFDIAVATLPGRHNQENILAAVATAMLYGVSSQAIQQALSVFKGAAHRLERLDAANGLRYYNDSKATNVDAVVCALEAFQPSEAVLIAGGRDKMTPLEPFVEAVKAYVHRVVLIGEAADRFEITLRDVGFTAIERANTLADAVALATRIAAPDSRPVVFSPACSSFDMFKNYEERGDAFKAIVQALPATSVTPSEVSHGPLRV